MIGNEPATQSLGALSSRGVDCHSLRFGSTTPQEANRLASNDRSGNPIDTNGL